jgi:hypothetical protein
MNARNNRIATASGSPYAVGFSFGQQIGYRLGENIEKYIRLGPGKHRQIDRDQLRAGAIPWMRMLPERFQQEMEGLAVGSGVSLRQVAEWCYAEECQPGGCSAFMIQLENYTWVARNNDLWARELWGYATVRAVDGCIPTIHMGMEAEPFTSTGLNRELIWLHYNYLPEEDKPSGSKRVLPPYVLITELLETCASLGEVEAALENTERAGGMMLFALDGKTQEYAIYECGCQGYNKRQAANGWLAGTNHACACETVPLSTSSYTRYKRMVAALDELNQRPGKLETPEDLIRVLADPMIEQRGDDSVTVFAAIACPGDHRLWYTFGGNPAANRGNWQPIPWPWE